MTLISRYLVRDFLQYLVLCLTALVSLVVLANMLGNVETAFSSWLGFLRFVDRTVRTVPTVLELLLPVSVLLATMFTFNALSRNSELIAMKAAGVGTARMILPIMLVLVPIAALGYWNQNYLHRALNAQSGQGRSADSTRHQWRSWGDKVFYLRKVDAARNTLADIRIFQWVPEPFRLRKIAKYTSGTRDAERWVFNDGVLRQKRAGTWTLETKSQLEIPAQDFPDVYLPVAEDAHHLPLPTLSREIRLLEKQGQPTASFVLAFHQKLAAAFALFLMVLVAAPLSQFHFRRGQVAGEVMLCILAGIIFWMSNELFLILGKGGYLHPILSAWVVSAAYLALSMQLLRRIR